MSPNNTGSVVHVVRVEEKKKEYGPIKSGGFLDKLSGRSASFLEKKSIANLYNQGHLPPPRAL